MTFSSRTDWHRQPNRLTEHLEVRRASGGTIFDLTNSNPTDCGILYPEKEILPALSDPHILLYQPDPRGLLSAREAIAGYYHRKNLTVDPSNIFLTSSTSEAYSIVLKLLCNEGESMLVPQPSYPLFEYLARVNDVTLQHYRLTHDQVWQVDIDSIRQSITPATKAIVLINPHNPTGMVLTKDEFSQIATVARENNLAIIVDEVFIDYGFDDTVQTIGSTSGAPDVLTFTLNGISKMCGLPQMKLGWMIVGGESRSVREATERLEILCDTFLSVNTPAQVALPGLMKTGASIRDAILSRLRSNYKLLCNRFPPHAPSSTLTSQGGWYGIIRVPHTRSDEEWALELLEKRGVYLFPGYFFDFEKEGYLVVSLLVRQETFECAMREMAPLLAG